MEQENFKNLNEKKKSGRPKGSIKTEYSFFHPDKKNLLPELRNRKGEHVNRIIRYKCVYDGVTYQFATISQIQSEFNLTYSIAGHLLKIFKKNADGQPLTGYETRLIESYSKLTVFEKIPINKKKKMVGFIKGNHTDTSLNLSINVPVR